jgi:hypothetical protein
MNRIGTFLIVGLIAYVPGLACAQGRSPVPLLQPYFTDQSDSFRFRAYEDDQGGFYLVWTDAQDQGAPHLMAQHFSDQGKAVWPSSGIVVTSELLSYDDWNGLADGKGGLVLYWDDPDGIGAGRFGRDGARLCPGASVLMSSFTALQPAAVPDASGGTYVAWADKRISDFPYLYAQHLDADRKPLWPKGGIRVTLQDTRQTNPAMVYDNMSGFIVGWRNERQQSSELRVQRIDSQGNRLWGDQGRYVIAPMGAEEYPNMVPLGHGDAVLAWLGYGTDTTRIVLQKIAADGTLAWGTDGRYASNDFVNYNRWNPLLAGDDSHQPWISWVDIRNRLNYQLFANHFDDAGNALWSQGEISVAPAPGDQGRAGVQVDGQGGLWLAWMDNRYTDLAMYAQRVDPQRNLLLGPNGLRIGPGMTKPSPPIIVNLVPGKAVTCWSDRRSKKDWALYWVFLPSKVAPPSTTGFPVPQ